jgi:hypothetical protein
VSIEPEGVELFMDSDALTGPQRQIVFAWLRPHGIKNEETVIKVFVSSDRSVAIVHHIDQSRDRFPIHRKRWPHKDIVRLADKIDSKVNA